MSEVWGFDPASGRSRTVETTIERKPDGSVDIFSRLVEEAMVNRISEAEQERLGLFTEETGEANQIIGKILRHGIDSYHPEEPGLSNAQLLELEIGHVIAAIDILVACGTLDSRAIFRAKVAKLQKLGSWLHCGTNLDAIEELLRRDLQTLREREAEAVELLTPAEQNQKDAAAAHRCDGTNIAQAEDGSFYCAHCGWNDQKSREVAFACGKCGGRWSFAVSELRDGWPPIESGCCGSGAWTTPAIP